MATQILTRSFNELLLPAIHQYLNQRLKQLEAFRPSFRFSRQNIGVFQGLYTRYFDPILKLKNGNQKIKAGQELIEKIEAYFDPRDVDTLLFLFSVVHIGSQCRNYLDRMSALEHSTYELRDGFGKKIVLGELIRELKKGRYSDVTFDERLELTRYVHAYHYYQTMVRYLTLLVPGLDEACDYIRDDYVCVDVSTNNDTNSFLGTVDSAFSALDKRYYVMGVVSEWLNPDLLRGTVASIDKANRALQLLGRGINSATIGIERVMMQTARLDIGILKRFLVEPSISAILQKALADFNPEISPYAIGEFMDARIHDVLKEMSLNNHKQGNYQTVGFLFDIASAGFGVATFIFPGFMFVSLLCAGGATYSYAKSFELGVDGLHATLAMKNAYFSTYKEYETLRESVQSEGTGVAISSLFLVMTAVQTFNSVRNAIGGFFSNSHRTEMIHIQAREKPKRTVTTRSGEEDVEITLSEKPSTSARSIEEAGFDEVDSGAQDVVVGELDDSDAMDETATLYEDPNGEKTLNPSDSMNMGDDEILSLPLAPESEGNGVALVVDEDLIVGLDVDSNAVVPKPKISGEGSATVSNIIDLQKLELLMKESGIDIIDLRGLARKHLAPRDFDVINGLTFNVKTKNLTTLLERLKNIIRNIPDELVELKSGLESLQLALTKSI